MHFKFTLLAQATTGGGRELEKRYGLARCLRRLTSSWGPVVYPPAAPPNAFPRVLLMISTCPVGRPKCSSVPLKKITIIFRHGDEWNRLSGNVASANTTDIFKKLYKFMVSEVG